MRKGGRVAAQACGGPYAERKREPARPLRVIFAESWESRKISENSNEDLRGFGRIWEVWEGLVSFRDDL